MKKLVWVKTASFCPLNDKNGVVLALPYFFFLNFRQYQNDVILDIMSQNDVVLEQLSNT